MDTRIDYTQFDYSTSIDAIARYTTPDIQKIVLRGRALFIVDINDTNPARGAVEFEDALQRMSFEVFRRVTTGAISEMTRTRFELGWKRLKGVYPNIKPLHYTITKSPSLSEPITGELKNNSLLLARK